MEYKSHMSKKIAFLTSSIILFEWIELILYLYLGTIFSQYFLGNNAESLIYIYAIFAISYLGRPIGGLVFGYFSDKYGRKGPLLMSSLLVGVSTLSISLIPSFENISWYAPIFLLLARFIQSIAVSGEFNNASIYLLEHSQDKKTFASCLPATAASAGMLVALAISYLIGNSSNIYLWKYVYFILGLMSIIIFFLRKNLSESPEYIKRFKSTSKKSIWRTLLQYKKELFQLIFLGSFLSIFIYIYNGLFMSYIAPTLNYSANYSKLIMAFTQLCVTLLIPIIALYAEKRNYRVILKSTIPLIGLMSLCLFYGALLGNSNIVVIGLILYILGNASISATIFRYLAENLPTEVRCTGCSFTYSLAVAFLGSTAPLLGELMIQKHSLLGPAYYICIFTFIAYLCVNLKDRIKA